MLQLIIVTVLSIMLCLFTNVNARKKRWFPLSMIIITIFYAIRYNYGLDYVAYHDLFERGATSTSYRDNQEVLFYNFMNVFPYFYQFVLVYTILIIGGIYALVNKFCHPKYYALFIFLFMLVFGMSTNLMSAMRSSIAALILWGGLYFFYFRKKKWIYLILVILLASGFHLSVLSFLALPFFDYIIPKINTRVIFAIICSGYILSYFGNSFLYEYIFSSNTLFNSYNSYSGFIEENNRSIFGVLNNAMYLLPTYFICKNKDAFYEKGTSGIYIIAIVYMLVFAFNIDFQGRFTSYIGIFFILAVCQQLELSSHYVASPSEGIGMSKNVMFVIAPLLFKTLLDFYKYYLSLLSPFYLGLEGNPITYQTIFDAPYFPF